MNNILTDHYYTPIQLKIPVDLEKIIEISDPVYTFNKVMAHIDLRKYVTAKDCGVGRPRYDAVKLLKVILFAFMENGCSSLRNIEKLCKTDVRFIWLLDGSKAPSYATVCNFLNHDVGENINTLFNDISKQIFEMNGVDLTRIYIDGTKIEANANKYTWVWKKSCLTSRNKVYAGLTALLTEINSGSLSLQGVRIETREEYAIGYVEEITKKFAETVSLDVSTFVHGCGHRKSAEQRQYEKLNEYLDKLKKYANHIEICGEDRNSYSKTDRDATFMRVKKDHMGNDQLLPAYNMQIGVCDEYIAVIDAKHYASDMDCFVPLMDKFKAIYGFYPAYPVADAGYGSYNNYLFCEKYEIGKYMKFPMFDKERKDPKYRDNPYRAVNFGKNENGDMVCPEGRTFAFMCKREIKGNKYGRTEEIYKCESCEGCPRKAECCRGKGDRTVCVNRELTAIHQEVLTNLQSELGITLRKNRSIQAEGTFGSVKWNRSYKRAKRRGIDPIILEFSLIAIGFNLYKYHNKTHRQSVAA